MHEETETPAPSIEQTMGEVYDRVTAEEPGTEDATPAPDAAPEAEDAREPDAPEHWPEADRAAFAGLAAPGREFLLRRHREMEADYTRKTQELAGHRRAAEAFAEAAKPYQAMIAAEGATPLTAFRALLHTAHVLRTGTPAEKAQSLAAVAQRFGVAPGAAPLPIAQPDPRQRALAEELARFRGATDAAGKPQHPHFDQVAGEIGALLMAGRAATVADAYERAVWAHPETRALQLAAADAARADAARRRASEARRSVNVRAGAAPGQRTRGASIEETMAMVYDRMAGREAD